MSSNKIENINKSSENKNTGCVEYQLEAVNARIAELQKHFAMHPKDKNSKRGFLTLISKRKKMIKYSASRKK